MKIPWQPMASAPKDGRVLVVKLRAGVMTVQWCDERQGWVIPGRLVIALWRNGEAFEGWAEPD